MEEDLKKLKKDDHFTTQCNPLAQQFEFDPEDFCKDKVDFDTSNYSLTYDELKKYAIDCTLIRKKFEDKARNYLKEN